MDRRFEDIETDSTVDNTLDQMDTSDPEIHFRALARGIDAGQLSAGNVGPVAVGPRTDADARQAAAPDTFGNFGTHFSPRDSRAATPPSAAAEAMCNAVPVGRLVVLFAVMSRARVHPNDQEFIPSMLISGLSLRTFQ